MEKIKRVEEITKQVEMETDFEKLLALFSEGAVLVKQLLADVSKSKGRVLEIIREIDGFAEKELRV